MALFAATQPTAISVAILLGRLESFNSDRQQLEIAFHLSASTGAAYAVNMLDGTDCVILVVIRN